MYVHDLIAEAGGLVTADRLQAGMSRKMVRTNVRMGAIVWVCHGAYASTPPDVLGQLAALDLMVGRPLVPCLGTAARLHGFDTEPDGRVPVLDPGIRMRPTAGVMVHQREGALLSRVQGRLATAPAWTAVEVARTLRRDLWRGDFVWPDAKLVVEYDSMQWHATPEALRHDRMKTARLQECGFTMVPIVVDDVRLRPWDLVGPIFHHLG